jgi:hypothetical protein
LQETKINTDKECSFLAEIVGRWRKGAALYVIPRMKIAFQGRQLVERAP